MSEEGKVHLNEVIFTKILRHHKNVWNMVFWCAKQNIWHRNHKSKANVWYLLRWRLLSSKSGRWIEGDPAAWAICGSCCGQQPRHILYKCTIFTTLPCTGKFMGEIFLVRPREVFLLRATRLVAHFTSLEYRAADCRGWDIPCKGGSTDFHIVTNLWGADKDTIAQPLCVSHAQKITIPFWDHYWGAAEEDEAYILRRVQIDPTMLASHKKISGLSWMGGGGEGLARKIGME